MQNTGLYKLVYFQYSSFNRTYDKVTVKPGRYLNVIIGPNGSGKSTIVAAIVLGLGGKPNIIGRALHIGEYVKYGRDSAKIEIRLKNDSRQDSVITRIFTKEGKSTWTINGSPSNFKNIQEFTSTLNIQVYLTYIFNLVFLEGFRFAFNHIKKLFSIRFFKLVL